jgi:predicted NBD/HSP70 family sugar kinase
MTDKKLMELLVVIDDHYGRIRSKEERMADTKIYIQAFGAIPDEIVEKALYTAFTQCRYQNQLIVDWCAEVKKLLAAGLPSANDLWNDAAVAARKIEANLYYMHIGGLITLDGKLNRDDLKRRNAEIFAALPVAVQRWAGSPEDLSDIFSSRSTADLRQFVRPGFDRAVQDAPVESLQPPALPGGAAPAQIGGGTT